VVEDDTIDAVYDVECIHIAVRNRANILVADVNIRFADGLCSSRMAKLESSANVDIISKIEKRRNASYFPVSCVCSCRQPIASLHSINFAHGFHDGHVYDLAEMTPSRLSTEKLQLPDPESC
jgi:hypothetical protein